MKFSAVFCCLVFLGCAPGANAAPEPIFQGVTLETETRSSPRPLKLYWLEADLKAPGVSLEFSPPADGQGGHVHAQLPTVLIRQLGWQAIINADAFHDLTDPGQKYPHPGDMLALQGLFISHGRLLNPPIRNDGAFYRRKDGSLGIGYEPYPVPEIENAVGGYRAVLLDGEVPPNNRAAFHPRTVVGINNTTHHLIWLIVDGRQPGVSEGALEEEVGQWMKERGAESALSLDGGGSSILALDRAGTVAVVNRPVGVYDKPGTERAVANCLGLKALPLPHPVAAP